LQTGVLIASNVALTIWDKVVILLQIIFGKPVFILFIVLLFFSVLVWLLDHKHANSPFSHEPLKGIARAFWFQASTFTTVAYGDTVPARASSKAVTLASIFLYVFLLSAFIASMTAEITVLQTATARITSLTELHDKKVGYLKTEPLAKEDIEKYSGRALPYDSLEDAVKALVEHRISAVFASRLQLRYFLTIHPESDVLLTRFDIYHGDYTFMLKPDAPYESRINMSLYKVKLSGKLDEIIARYVGHDHAALANS
jgi:ABC-type amino acid transport substrate-binding protein